MKILYVAGMGIPLRDILSGKSTEEVTHSPGFFQPWHRLTKRGHQVDFVVTSNFNEPHEINVDWFSQKNIKANIYDPVTEVNCLRRIPRRISRLLRLIYHVDKALRSDNYDFVICWAFFEGFVGNVIANMHGVPCGMRSMGTLLVPEIRRRGPVLTALRHPVEYMSFKLRKAFFLMTDDGTNGDELFQAWRPARKKYDYLFWKTGVTFKTVDHHPVNFEKPSSDYIFFAARFDEWKRHDLVIQTIRELHAMGHCVHLYFAGSIQSTTYFQKISEQVNQSGLSNYVHYLGVIPTDQVRLYAYHAVANIFMYDVSNLGNVFFETLTAGCVIVGKDDGSLNEYIEPGLNGFLVKNTTQAAKIVGELLSGVYDIPVMRKAAIEISHSRCFSMAERFDAEIAMIERVVETGETGIKAEKDGICRLKKGLDIRLLPK